MKKLRLYLDTSVVGGCFDSEFATWSNGLVADFGAERLRPVVSELVAANVDVLVSWNFKHIVRLQKIRLYSAVNLEAGYRPIEIYSPREVVSYEE